MSFRSFRPAFNDTNIRPSQVPGNAFDNFSSNRPPFRFENNFTHHNGTVSTAPNNFSNFSVRHSVLHNVRQQHPSSTHTHESNLELKPQSHAFHNQFVPRLPPSSSLMSHLSMSNSIHTLNHFPPLAPPVPLLSPQRFSGPNLNQPPPSTPSVGSNGPVLQNSQHQVHVFNHQPQNIAYNQNVNLQNILPVTSNYQGHVNNMYPSQNNSFGGISSSLPKLPAKAFDVPGSINNLNNVSSSVNTSHPLPTIYTNELVGSVNNNNRLVLHPVLSGPLQLPPPVIPSATPVHMPPPYIPKSENSSYMHSSSSLLSDNRENNLKLSQFLAKFSIMKKEKQSMKVAIPEFRSALATAFSISKELSRRKQKLHDLLQSDESTWNSEIVQISKLKNKLSEICVFVSDPQYLKIIMKKLQLIKKKREQKRQTKLIKKSAKMKAEQQRNELNQEIDKWFDDIKEKNLKLKREAEMKKEADIILLEVRKKIHEAKRTIEKIKVFEKLRNARKENAVKKGLHITSEHDENFESKVSILKVMMSRQLADYEAEERALKVMLETEQEGQLEEEARWKLKKVKALQKKKQKYIVECLFGNSEDPLPTDPLYLFHKYHTSAYNSIDNLIQIRHQWDVHLSEDGEAIPQPWVIPTAARDAMWEKCLTTASGEAKN